MKAKQLLRFVLILFIVGTIITLSMSIIYITNESTTPPLTENPLFVTYSSKTDFGIPAPWLSYTHNRTDFNPYHKGLGSSYSFYPVVISEYTFLWFGFIEDVLVYTSTAFLVPLTDYLIKLIIHWRFGKNLDLQRNPTLN